MKSVLDQSGRKIGSCFFFFWEKKRSPYLSLPPRQQRPRPSGSQSPARTSTAIGTGVQLVRAPPVRANAREEQEAPPLRVSHCLLTPRLLWFVSARFSVWSRAMAAAATNVNVKPLNGAEGYLRWKESMLLRLHTVGVAHVLSDDPPPPAGVE